MRRKLIAGNWKMNLDLAGAVALARAIAADGQRAGDAELAVCPPFPYLQAVREALGGAAVGLGAQNMYFEPNGAYTGEVSAEMLVDLGCRFVILGHSERRHILGESNEEVAKKTSVALRHGLTPIVCLGETLQEREAGRTSDVVAEQFTGSLGHLSADDMRKVVLAYEPVWAIGTGKVATPDQAEEVHADLRKMIETRYNEAVAQNVRIQYGGSMKPDNAADLLRQPNIDGGLIGGASLKADSFLAIAAAG